MRPFLILLLAWCAVAEDRWFTGTLAGQPLASMRLGERVLADGSRESTSEILLVLRRAMPGQPELRLAVRETGTVIEDSQGAISGWRFDRDENGTIVTASGTVAQQRVVGTVARLGRTTPVLIDLPAGVELVGDARSQRQLVERKLATGQSIEFTSLALLQNDVRLVTSTATARGRAGEVFLFDVIADAMPLPMRLRLDPTGNLIGMTMNLGVMVLELKPAAGPVALLGAELPPNGLVQAAGPRPRRDTSNRYRIPAGPPLPPNPLQTEQGGLVTSSSESVPAPLVGTWTAATAQLELDDPALRDWVGSIGSDPESLRLAVRSHINRKDLMKGDASALETFRSRQGDCTEHATLLCAALRIAGIPARIEVGLVYAPDYGGWVGHAWNQAYAGGRWIHLDSAYPGIPRSCYLGLGFSDDGQAGAALLVQLNRFIGQTVEVVP